MRGSKNKTTLLALALVALVGCAKKENSTSVSTRGTGPRTTHTTTVSGLSMSGTVTADASYQQQFQDAVLGFLSTDVKPDYVGTVSATGQNGSGVRFGGQVRLSTGKFNSSNSYGSVATDSRFAIQVVDYVPEYPDAPLIPPFSFKQASGNIYGNSAQIVFQDAYGQVMLAGNLDWSAGVFEGTISYDNNVLYDGTTPGAAGTLGTFRVGICSFFVCQ